ncbi:zinc-alpha-2-glycoprotein-like [Scomber scombrus]|uniref:Zinc-alpha-2-glycoprotein-like n=1 Tax=Scomber scombrus TaxID=13677 RepID=A0AAV1Q318_SCOSC
MTIKRIKLLIQSFLFLSSCLKAACGSPSLTFLSTALVRSGDGPLAEQLTVYDGVPISHCNGLTEEAKLKQTLQSNPTPLQHCYNAIADMVESLYVIPKYINNTVYLRVFGKPTDNPEQALLICHVTSTDTSVTSVHLTGNGACRASQITVPGPLPSGDGSVIIRLTARISLNQYSNTCGCTVQTDSRDITVSWDGYTLDGRYLLYHTVNWLTLIGKIGFGLVFLTLIVIFVFFAVKKSRRPPKVDPQLIKQFTRMCETLTNPDVQSVMASFIQGAEINREYQERWEEWKKSKDQNYYDRDFYGGHVKDIDSLQQENGRNRNVLVV